MCGIGALEAPSTTNTAFLVQALSAPVPGCKVSGGARGRGEADLFFKDLCGDLSLFLCLPLSFSCLCLMEPLCLVKDFEPPVPDGRGTLPSDAKQVEGKQEGSGYKQGLTESYMKCFQSLSS